MKKSRGLFCSIKRKGSPVMRAQQSKAWNLLCHNAKERRSANIWSVATRVFMTRSTLTISP